MKLFQVLQVLDAEVLPPRCKVHLACWVGRKIRSTSISRDDSMNGSPFVVSLIDLSRDNQWLFAGVHDSGGCEWVEERDSYHYRLSRRAGPNEMDGRLVVRFVRPGRQSYLLGDKWSDVIEVTEIRPQKMRIAEFPGYRSAMLTKQHLDIVLTQAIESWRSALVNEEGIWNRWCAYSATGHGGNHELVALLQREGAGYAENFQFGVLEIADTHASVDDVLRRESHWKDLLLTRVPHGYNSN